MSMKLSRKHQRIFDDTDAFFSALGEQSWGKGAAKLRARFDELWNDNYFYAIKSKYCAFMDVLYDKAEYYNEYLCHNPLNQNMFVSSDYVGAINLACIFFTRNMIKDASKDLLGWILDPIHSPWALGIQDIWILKDKDGVPLLMVKPFPDGKREDTVGLFMGATIASRMIPGIGVAQGYAHLRSLGFSPSTAYFIAMQFTWAGMQVNYGMMTSSYYNGKGDFSLLTKSGPVASDSPFSIYHKTSDYRPSDAVLDETLFQFALLKEDAIEAREVQFRGKLAGNFMHKDSMKCNTFFHGGPHGIMREMAPNLALFSTGWSKKQDPLNLFDLFRSESAASRVKEIEEILMSSTKEIVFV